MVAQRTKKRPRDQRAMEPKSQGTNEPRDQRAKEKETNQPRVQREDLEYTDPLVGRGINTPKSFSKHQKAVQIITQINARIKNHLQPRINDNPQNTFLTTCPKLISFHMGLNFEVYPI